MLWGVLIALSAASAQRLAPLHRIAPGVEIATAAELGGDAGWAARVVLIDPAHAVFLVRYDAKRPTLAEWRRRFPQALAIANGSFYSVEGAEVRPTCDVVASGKAVRGAGCRRQDALFFGARPREAALVSREPSPLAPRLLAPADFRAEEWQEALKSFPALVRAGAAVCGGVHYCAEQSRTAAIAQLKDGRILIFASQWPAVRREVGRWLAEGLGAVAALNLDGGPEATLAIRGEAPEQAIGTPGVGLPMVVLVLPP
jgi:hypothetical protein